GASHSTDQRHLQRRSTAAGQDPNLCPPLYHLPDGEPVHAGLHHPGAQQQSQIRHRIPDAGTTAKSSEAAQPNPAGGGSRRHQARRATPPVDKPTRVMPLPLHRRRDDPARNWNVEGTIPTLPRRTRRTHRTVCHQRHKTVKTLFNHPVPLLVAITLDRKSTRLNSSHVKISYAVFC